MSRVTSDDSVRKALASAVRTVASIRPGKPGAARAVGLGGLAFGVVAIAATAIAFVSLAAVAGVLLLYAEFGREGLSDLMTEVRFDPVLKARLAAAAVSAIYVGVALATLAAARLAGGRGWKALLGLGTRAVLRRGTVAVAVATLGYAALFTLVEIGRRERHLTISGPTDYLLLGLLCVNLVMLAPLAEELFFRGWLYTGLRARWSFLPSYLATAALFAAIHWDADHRHMLRVLPLALALGLLRELTGSIRPTVALHLAYNLVIVTLTLLAA